MAIFEARTELACSPEAAFNFLIRPENIRLISPSAMMLVFDEAPEQLSMGSIMKFRVQAYGVVRQIVHSISVFEAPNRYVEHQIEGPMGEWEHEHLFERTPNGVMIVDRIEFTKPGGMLGLIINERKIQESLEDGFGHRHEVLEKHFGTPSGAK